MVLQHWLGYVHPICGVCHLCSLGSALVLVIPLPGGTDHHCTWDKVTCEGGKITELFPPSLLACLRLCKLCIVQFWDFCGLFVVQFDPFEVHPPFPFFEGFPPNLLFHNGQKFKSCVFCVCGALFSHTEAGGGNGRYCFVPQCLMPRFAGQWHDLLYFAVPCHHVLYQ